MNRIDLFSFTSYKDYLSAHEETRPRGFRALLAKAAKCQPSYISQVFSGEGQLSPEQAETFNELLGHDDQHANYFLLLVQQERAATPALRKRIQSQIKHFRDEHKRLKNRVAASSLSSEAQMTYYSSWKYGAVHAAISIPHLNSPEKIGKSLAIPVSQVANIISFLLKVGILEDNHGKIKIGQARLHLSDDSPHIFQYHSHWRFKALESLSRSDIDNHARRLHYSSVISLSAKDVAEIREVLMQKIMDIKRVIAKSHEEHIYGFNLDFYPVESDLSK